MQFPIMRKNSSPSSCDDRGAFAKSISQDDDNYSDAETERRATEALRRSLTSPPKPQKEMVGRVGRPKAKRKLPLKSDPKAR
jgi:hypothetical protein